MPSLPETAFHQSSLLETSVAVETPEQITLSYSVAGIGSRATAACLDWLICGLVLFVLLLVCVLGSATVGTAFRRLGTGDASITWVIAVFILVQFVIVWGYYVLFEGLADGQTPGKRLLKLRVVRDGGYSVSFGASALRNILRVLDAQPAPMYLVGIITSLCNTSGKRLGDFLAGTFVVKESVVVLPTTARDITADSSQTPSKTSSQTPVPATLGISAVRPTAQLTDEEYTLLDRFMARRMALSPERRQAFIAQLAKRFAAVLSAASNSLEMTGQETPAAALVRLYEAERVARATGVASRSDTGARREQHAIVALGTPRWSAFATALEAARRRTLRRMSAEEVSALVAHYREVTSDLARLQTATRGRSSDALFYVSRLVARGHNLLYRQKNLTFATVLAYLLYEIPREVRRSWVPIALSAVLLFGPAIGAYLAVERNPARAPSVLPDEMLSRAELGRARERHGEGYVTIEEAMRPIAASSIIANNVQVTYAVFALGLTCGVGTILMLVFNGVSIGAAVGLFAAKGIAHLILNFMAPHGILELSAICMGAGGGLLLGSALLTPGARTRKEALVENGRRAITLIAGATLLLLVAGTIEGVISPRVWPMAWKVAVSVATAIVLGIYLSLRDVPRNTSRNT